MRRVASALHSLVVDTIGLEGFLIAGGLAGLTVVAWSIDWTVGVTVASIAALTIGIAIARPTRT